jgi:8-oxo-dGTP diphosphatase
MRHRVVGIIIKDEKILLMRRVKNDREYYVFPGGGVEEGESLEEALRREMHEELGIRIRNPRLLFELDNQLSDQYGGHMTGYPNEHYFLIGSFSGEPQLGGPEKERMDDTNQYFLEWTEVRDAADVGKIANLYPREAVKRLSEVLTEK